jgi:hypothetical protein
MNVTKQITNWVRQDTEDRWLISRFIKAVNTVKDKKGYKAATMMVLSVVAIKVYALAVAYFTAEGSIRALIDLATNNNSTDVVKLRSLGDSGGWSALTVFSLFGAITLLIKFIREGEYLQLKESLISWYENNKSVISENPESFANLYETINDLLDASQSQCLFQKSLISRRLTALDILNDLPKKCPLHRRDNKLKAVFSNIQTELEKTTSMKYYPERLYEGQRSVSKNGCCRSMTTLIMGVAIPLILLTTVIFSYIGEFGLGKELFIEREELTDVGHFGEWPINAIEAIATAFFFHFWFMLSEGDFVRTRNVYKANLQNLKETSSKYNRVATLGNEELKELSSGVSFKLPGQYEIKKI